MPKYCGRAILKRVAHQHTGGARLGATESSLLATGATESSLLATGATESSLRATTTVYTSNCGYTFFYPHNSYVFFGGEFKEFKEDKECI